MLFFQHEVHLKIIEIFHSLRFNIWLSTSGVYFSVSANQSPCVKCSIVMQLVAHGRRSNSSWLVFELEISS